MRTVYRHRLCLCLLVLSTFAAGKVAAVPEVVLESDPLTSRHCASAPAGTLTLSDATLSTADSVGQGVHLYQTGFYAATWSGSLRKLPLGFSADGTVSPGTAVAEWDAADLLTATPQVERQIYTAKIDADQSLLTVPFLWNVLSAMQQAALHRAPEDGSDDQRGIQRLDYLRGGRRYELGQPGGIFRVRERVLGAIGRSTPLFVGAPAASQVGNDYAAFYAAHKSRRPAVYVGAYDGMLHAFDAGTGKELFAYIPLALFDRLGQLTRPDAGSQPYVDGAMVVAEALLGQQWKTVLVSGMGGGAQGVFALDVSQPERFDQGLGALWEFSDADDPDIGHVFGAPLIARFSVGVSKGVASYRYFAVVSSGLNNYRDDGKEKFNRKASNALFLLALDKPRSEKWVAGVNYFKFITTISDEKIANGLAAPALIFAADGSAHIVYAGDLQGNLWRFDFSGNAPWPHALGSKPFKPLFTAMNVAQKRQAITQKPAIVYAPESGYIVLFGTGKWMEGSDLESGNFQTQSFYAVRDTLNVQGLGRSRLKERKLAFAANGKTLEISGADFRYGTQGAGESGWYVDFIDSAHSGERSISPARIMDGKLFFNTLIPNRDPCRSADSRAYLLNTLSGLPDTANNTGYFASAAMPFMPVITIVAPSAVGERDASGKRSVKKKITVLDPVTGDGARTPMTGGALETVATAGRLSWREIINWAELRISTEGK